MAGVGFQAINSAAVALSAATAKTIVSAIAPSQQRVLVREWSGSFDGVTSSAVPVLVEIVYFTGGGVGTALAPTKTNQGDPENLQSTAKENYTTEPAGAVVIDSILVSPTSGFKEIRPLGQEIPVPGGKMIGIRCNAPATVNVRGTLKCVE